jgi:hypothetical protein
MHLVSHGLGCSILTVADMDNPNFVLRETDAAFSKATSVNVMKKSDEGMTSLVEWLKGRSRAGILMWVDTSETDYSEGWWDTSDMDDDKEYKCSGKKFYKMLKSRGYHVEKTPSYKNPGHDGKCSMYWWHFRKAPGRLAKKARGKAVAKKAKTTSNRAAT